MGGGGGGNKEGVREWMGEENSDIEKKTEKSKAQVPRAPPLLTLPPPFKRLHKQGSECWVSERST